MKKASTKSFATVSYKDEQDETFFEKKYTLDTTISEIVNKVEEIISINIEFSGVHLFNYLEFIEPDPGMLRFTFDFNIDSIVPKEEKDNWKKIAHKLNTVIWKHKSKIMKIFDRDELAVLWGGPETTKVEYDLGINYYVDDSCTWFMLEIFIKGKENYSSLKLDSFRSQAVKMSAIVQEIINDKAFKSLL